MSQDPYRILVVCTGNRARSQMVHGWFRHLGGRCVLVDSAGTEPKGVHPVTVAVMSEVGIDISHHTADSVNASVNVEYDLVLTLCDVAKANCPVFPNARRTLHHAFEDPDYPDMSPTEFHKVFRRIRDAIGDYSRELLREVL